MATNALEIRDLHKRFGAVSALSGVDLRVDSGEVLALVGENGAGKSTLLSILSGHLAPDSGSIRWNGEDVVLSSPRDAATRGIHVVRQEPTLYPDLSVAENLLAGSLPTRLGRFVRQRDTYDLAARRLANAGIADLIPLRSVVRELGPGERQLVEIAKAITHSHGVRLVAFDEPTSSLAADSVARLMQIVRTLQADGVAIIYVSHRMQETFHVADRITVLRDGRSVGDLPKKGTRDSEVFQLMVGRELRQISKEPNSSRDAAPVLSVTELSTLGLRDITFRLAPGEILGVAGLVKSGRSRLARALFGRIPLLGGTIELAGRAVRIASPSEALRAGIVLVPEDRHLEGLVLSRSVLENLTLGRLGNYRRLRFLSRSQERTHGRDVVSSLRVKTQSIDTAVDMLSGGNQQKIVLGRAISRSASVLILDEPTRGVDVGAKAEIYELILQLAKDGTAIMLISSELPELLLLSDRILVMREGRISGDLPRDSATEEKLLSLAMPAPTTQGTP
jgi:L-arabinose transport system ATP-binding protein